MALQHTTYENTTRIIDSVIECAFARFARYGFRKTTVDEIAADAGISKRTLYIVFPSKEEILREGVWRQLNSAMDSFTSSLPDSISEHGILLDLCRFIFTDRIEKGKSGHFHGLHSDDAYIQAAWNEALKRIYRDIMLEGIQKGHFKPVDCDLASETVIGILRAVLDHNNMTSVDAAFPEFGIHFISDTVSP